MRRPSATRGRSRSELVARSERLRQFSTNRRRLGALLAFLLVTFVATSEEGILGQVRANVQGDINENVKANAKAHSESSWLSISSWWSTAEPTQRPTQAPTFFPTPNPTLNPTRKPTHKPTAKPTRTPTRKPTHNPTHYPTRRPTSTPTRMPTVPPSSRVNENSQSTVATKAASQTPSKFKVLVKQVSGQPSTTSKNTTVGFDSSTHVSSDSNAGATLDKTGKLKSNNSKKLTSRADNDPVDSNLDDINNLLEEAKLKLRKQGRLRGEPLSENTSQLQSNAKQQNASGSAESDSTRKTKSASQTAATKLTLNNNSTKSQKQYQQQVQQRNKGSASEQLTSAPLPRTSKDSVLRSYDEPAEDKNLSTNSADGKSATEQLKQNPAEIATKSNKPDKPRREGVTEPKEAETQEETAAKSYEPDDEAEERDLIKPDQTTDEAETQEETAAKSYEPDDEDQEEISEEENPVEPYEPNENARESAVDSKDKSPGNESIESQIKKSTLKSSSSVKDVYDEEGSIDKDRERFNSLLDELANKVEQKNDDIQLMRDDDHESH